MVDTADNGDYLGAHWSVDRGQWAAVLPPGYAELLAPPIVVTASVSVAGPVRGTEPVDMVPAVAVGTPAPVAVGRAGADRPTEPGTTAAAVFRRRRPSVDPVGPRTAPAPARAARGRRRPARAA